MSTPVSSIHESNDPPAARPTMQDVAHAAGVSLKTVSRVVNNEPRVDEKTRERVHQAIAQLGFRRNDIARSLRQKQTSSTIGLIIEDIANPFYSSIARGLEKVAQQYNYMLIISNSEENALRERELVNALLSRRVEGLCIVPAGTDHSYLAAELRRGTPFIFLDRPPLQLQTDTIVLDNRGGSRQAIRHLLAYGHRRIAVIQGDPRVYTGAERIAGYYETLAEHGIPCDESLIYSNCDEAQLAHQATHALMSLPQPPSAIFSTSNRISIAVLRALRSYTQQPAFIGFDDFDLADMLPTPITVVAHDPAAMGTRAAEILFARLAGSTVPFQQTIIPTRLIARGSGELPPPRA
ncbi:LacI family DNA-binding transcriptional regulator [Dictyobacter aurantiacus]|uniref:LacI family transcriptional regulator n=1 Tax=Dictyobacter aurantiacus TaxID=1936993 RepID=A0A401ZS15_9CHLR|nr:LacI family DNA-binding transcriptional regulator [Dictyobacter aurantiacus]GCE09596.1 LacI family transcriptional regulator [Dictyobacter aurantiacus]